MPNALGSSRPARIVPDDHFRVRMTHLMGDVLRILAARKLQRRVSVAALIQVAVPQRGPDQEPPPVALTEVGQVKWSAVLIQENEIASQLGARALHLKLIDYRWQHVNLTLAGSGLRQADPGEAMDAVSNPELLAIEVDIFPMKRECLVRPEPAEDEDRDKCAVLSGRALDQPFRLFEREGIYVALVFPEVLDEDHRVFCYEFATLCGRKDRAQSRDHHVDPARADRPTVEPWALHQLAEEAAYVPVVESVESRLCERCWKE